MKNQLACFTWKYALDASLYHRFQIYFLRHRNWRIQKPPILSPKDRECGLLSRLLSALSWLQWTSVSVITIITIIIIFITIAITITITITINRLLSALSWFLSQCDYHQYIMTMIRMMVHHLNHRHPKYWESVHVLV